MSEFIKEGNRIVPKPNGLDYDLVPKKVYNLMYNEFSGVSYFEEDGSLNLPSKVYSTADDDRFVKRVITYYNNTDKLSTGVMLSGIKGTGKTVLAKVIARDSGLPVIVVNENYPTRRINDFFKKFSTPVCVIFDEVDKNWNTEFLLGWLDGVQTNAKKLVLFTCNDDNIVSTYLKDRCSRVRYLRKFAADENTKFLKSIIADKGIDDKNDEIYTFITSSFNLLSMDNILSFLDEKMLFPEYDNFTIVKDMNIKLKDEFMKKMSASKNPNEPTKDLLSNVLNNNSEYYDDTSEYYDDNDDDDYDEDNDDEPCDCPECRMERDRLLNLLQESICSN